MVQIRPFKAIRPQKEQVDKIATLPYDVLSSDEARLLGERNHYSYLHIDKAEIDLPMTLSPYDEQVYETAKNNLQAFLEKGWLLKEDKPLLYLYELTMNSRSQTGIVACTSIDDYIDNKIKKHEFTRPEKELDRIKHIEACDANTSPIFLTYRNHDQIKKITKDWQDTHTSVYDFVGFHNVHHRVWIVDDLKTIQQLVILFDNDVSSLYIADGHHRTESAVKVGNKKQQTAINKTGEEEFNYFLSVIFPKEELEILDYNRVLSIPIPDNFLTILSKNFNIILAKNGKPNRPTSFGMYLKNTWYQLTAKDHILSSDPVEGLDVSLLQNYVFDEIFGITDVRTDKRIDFVGGIRGLGELERLVDSKNATVAFSIYPTTMDQLLQVADANKTMPPKSTWFEPKLLSGLFIHSLETNN